MTELTEKTFLEYAIRNYFSDEHINIDEFRNSIKRITYINRLLKKEDNVNHRLILNHIIITSNTFGVNPTVQMLFFKISEERHMKLRTYLFFLGYLAENEAIREKMELDIELLKILEEI